MTKTKEPEILGAIKQNIAALQSNIDKGKKPKDPEKSTAELLLLFDEEIDRLFLEDSMINAQDRVIHLREKARELGLRIKDDEIRKKVWQGRARKAGAVEMLAPGMAIDAPEEVWAWENIIMQSDTNLLVALPKVGKTTLIIDAIAKWFLKVSDDHLGQKFNGDCPEVVIVGTDMPKSRWMPLLGRFGLASLDEDKKWHLLENGPIKGLFTTNNPIHLDEAGLSRIADEVAKYKGCLLLCDSYAKLIQPFGLSEGDANFAGPLADLQEVVSPYDVTSIVIHHSGHARKGQGAVAASRGSTALPAAVSQVINMKWLRRTEDATDKRVVLETEGRGEDLSIVILQEMERWTLEGDASELMAQQQLEEDEAKLNDTQFLALELVRKRSPLDTTANDLVAEHGGSPRQARRTLEQLANKKLIKRGTKDSKGNLRYSDRSEEGPQNPLSAESAESQSLGQSGHLGHGEKGDTIKQQLPIIDVTDTKDTKDHIPRKKKCYKSIEKICMHCNVTFQAKRKDCKFCSTSCRAKNHHRGKTVKK